MKFTFINFLIILLGTPFFIKKSKSSKKHQNIEHFYTEDDKMTLQVQILNRAPEIATGGATPETPSTAVAAPPSPPSPVDPELQTSGTNNAQPSTIKVRYPNQDSPEQNCYLGVCNDESKCEVVTGQGLSVQKTDCIPISPYTLYAQYALSNNSGTPVAKGILYGSKDPNAPKKCWLWSQNSLLTNIKKAGVPIPERQWIEAPEYNMQGEKLNYNESVCIGRNLMRGVWKSWVINDP